MIEHYIWLTPVAVLAVLALFRFVACSSFSASGPGDTRRSDFTFGDPYADEVKSDNPAGYWRLQGIGLINHSVATSSAGPVSPAVTPAIDTSGATLLVLTVSDLDHDSTTDNVTDNFGNTWHHLGNSSRPGGHANAAIWYAWDHGGIPLVVGVGHTVTATGRFCSIELTAWSGIKNVIDPLDRQSTGAAHGTTAQPGSITPSADGCLVVTAAGFSGSGSYNIDSGYTITDQKNFLAAVNTGSAQAYFLQGSAAATNPNWSTGTATDIACAIASFLPASNTRNDKAKNEIAGKPDGDLQKATTPLPAGDPGWHSNALSTATLDVGAAGPPPISSTDKTVTSYRLNGGFVRVTYQPDLNPAEFTLEALVLPEWPDLTDGKYYCLLESSAPAAPKQKNQGYAIYAGPDDPGNPSSKSTWQFWIGDGGAFQRLALKNPLPAGDAGLEVVKEPTYLAVTYRGADVFFYMYYASRQLHDLIKYELVHLNYVPVAAASSQDLLIGISGPQRAVFAPFPGPDPPAGFLYAFNGRVAEVAIYSEAKREERIASHANAAFK
jgi:hypothetical protein